MIERERKTAAALRDGGPEAVAAMLTGSDRLTVMTSTHTQHRTAYRHVRKVNPTMPAWAVWAYIWRIIRAGAFSEAFPTL